MNILTLFSSRRGFLIVGSLVLLCLVVLGVGFSLKPVDADSSTRISAVVAREDLSLQIFERGLIAPAKVEPIKSQISSNQALLVWAVEEGSAVIKDQVIARFDTKPFNDKMEHAEQELADVQATLAATEKLISMKKVTLAGRVEAARRKLEIARIKEDDLLNGSGQLMRHELEQAIVQAQRVLVVAQTELDDMDLLLGKGHVSRRERDRVANDLLLAEEKVAIVTAEMDNFTRYKWPSLMYEAKLAVDAAGEELEQEKLTSELELQRAQGEIVKLKRDLEKAESRLVDARRDVVACDVRSPIDGILLYKELPRNDGRRKVQIGDAIWFGQVFMEIPDTSEMVVEVNVREVDVAKLHKGVMAEVWLDAIPDRMFQGEVEYIDALAKQENADQEVRSFRTRILLKETTPEMYPGMSASTRITYQELKDVLVVPVAAVSYKNRASFVRLQENNGTRDIPVQLGSAGGDKTVVLDGVKEGDHVLLNGS